MMKYCEEHNLPAENYDKIDKKWKCRKCHEEEIKKKVSVKKDRRR